MLIDENQILREVTLRVTGTLDIGQALVETRGLLAELMPMDEIILVRVDKTDLGLHLVIRVSGAGVTGEQNQFLFMLGEPKQKLAESRLYPVDKEPGVFVLSEITQELKALDIKERFRDLGLPECSDVLVLFDQRLHAALVAVSYRENAYNAEHVHLFELLREPFVAALNNALRYTEVRHMRDTLADDNLLFREATVRLTGEHDIGKAFHNTLLYLRRVIPIEQILLVSMDDRTADQRILLRVSEQGTIDEVEELLFSGTDLGFVQERDRIMVELPDTFVRRVDEDDFSMSREEKVAKVRQLGIPEDAVLIMLGVKAVRAGILFVCDSSAKSTWRRCIDILQMLKEPFIIALYNAIRFYEIERLKNHLEEDNRDLRRDMQRDAGDRVIGMNRGMKQVMSLVSQVAKTLSPVLLIGETGSGKEVIATAVHRFSDHGGGPFISLNCGAIPESLIDSELFGHERGAFTGANERKRGRFERADKGTLFLDEVGELPLSAQVRLLRVLQEKEFERIGGNQVIHADVRLIAATNRDLPAMVRDGRFREDLWFRLNVFPIEIPPLRKRREDIPALAYHFIETKCRQLNLAFRPALPAESLERLIAYDWPGNVRELQNAIERALILSRGEPLRFPYLMLSEAPEPPEPKKPVLAGRIPTYDEAVTAYLKSLLETTKGRIAGPKGAARIAGMNPSTLRSKLKKLGIAAMGE